MVIPCVAIYKATYVHMSLHRHGIASETAAVPESKRTLGQKCACSHQGSAKQLGPANLSGSVRIFVPFFRLARLLQRNDWNPAGTMIILRNPSKNAITKNDARFKIQNNFGGLTLPLLESS